MIPKQLYIFDLQISTKFLLSLVEVNQASIILVVSIDATMKRSCWLLGLHTAHCHSDKIIPGWKLTSPEKKIENGKVDMKIHPYFRFLGHFFASHLGEFAEGL